MKKKGSLSLLLAFGIVLSSFGVVMAANPMGGFGSSTGGFYQWEFDPNWHSMKVIKTNDTSPAGADFTDYASQVTSLHISDKSSGYYDGYSYSHFKTGMSGVRSITLFDNCKKLTIGSYCPNLELIDFANDQMDDIYVDLTGRSSGRLPSVTLSENTKAKHIYLDFEGYTGNSAVAVPANYGNDSRFDYDFSKSKNIISVSFEKGTKTIPEDAFYKCENLTYVTIPEGVTKIEYSAFKACPKLKSVSIPASVESIGMNAFKNSGIKDITYAGTRSQWYGLVKEYSANEELIGEALHLDNVAVHCSDGEVVIHYNKDDNPLYNEYYQNYFGWEKENGVWRYYGKDGQYYAHSIHVINGKVYSFDENGAMITGWHQYSNGNWFFYDRMSGEERRGWVNDNGNWYYLGSNGIMQTGWQQIDGSWYLFSSSGVMLTGWQKSGNNWYYLDKISGKMVTGWLKDGSDWYYLKSNGAMAAKEWCEGYWLNANGTWTYPHKATWRKTNNKWWFGDDSGWYAKSETLTIDGKSYTFDAKGYLV